jgi:hypothetical protein
MLQIPIEANKTTVVANASAFDFRSFFVSQAFASSTMACLLQPYLVLKKQVVALTYLEN